MSWKPEIEELHKREQMAREMGGADKVARQHEFGKLTVRERVDAIADPGSFHEIGTLAGVGRSNVRSGISGLITTSEKISAFVRLPEFVIKSLRSTNGYRMNGATPQTSMP